MTEIFFFCIIVFVSYLTKGSDVIKENKNIIFTIKVLDNIIDRKIITYTKQNNMPFGLSMVQLKILHYLFLHSNDIIYQRDIEKIIESRRSTTSGILNTMEKNNLIKRINSQFDARSKQIILTDYSFKISKIMIKQKKIIEEQIQKDISNKELEVFFKVADQIKTNIVNIK